MEVSDSPLTNLYDSSWLTFWFLIAIRKFSYSIFIVNQFIFKNEIACPKLFGGGGGRGDTVSLPRLFDHTLTYHWTSAEENSVTQGQPLRNANNCYVGRDVTLRSAWGKILPGSPKCSACTIMTTYKTDAEEFTNISTSRRRFGRYRGRFRQICNGFFFLWKM